MFLIFGEGLLTPAPALRGWDVSEGAGEEGSEGERNGVQGKKSEVSIGSDMVGASDAGDRRR